MCVFLFFFLMSAGSVVISFFFLILIIILAAPMACRSFRATDWTHAIAATKLQQWQCQFFTAKLPGNSHSYYYVFSLFFFVRLAGDLSILLIFSKNQLLVSLVSPPPFSMSLICAFFFMAIRTSYGNSWARIEFEPQLCPTLHLWQHLILFNLLHRAGDWTHFLDHLSQCSQILNPLCHRGNFDLCFLLLTLLWLL